MKSRALCSVAVARPAVCHPSRNFSVLARCARFGHFSSLALADWRAYDQRLDETVFSAITAEAAVAGKKTPQSTGPAAVARALDEARRWVSAH